MLQLNLIELYRIDPVAATNVLPEISFGWNAAREIVVFERGNSFIGCFRMTK
jgi:hypothetical protein